MYVGVREGWYATDLRLVLSDHKGKARASNHVWGPVNTPSPTATNGHTTGWLVVKACGPCLWGVVPCAGIVQRLAGELPHHCTTAAAASGLGGGMGEWAAGTDNTFLPLEPCTHVATMIGARVVPMGAGSFAQRRRTGALR